MPRSSDLDKAINETLLRLMLLNKRLMPVMAHSTIDYSLCLPAQQFVDISVHGGYESTETEFRDLIVQALTCLPELLAELDEHREISQEIYRNRPTHNVTRRGESLPCHCWSNSDHPIGYEVKKTATCLTEEQCVAIYDAVTRANFMRDMKTEARKQNIVNTALETRVRMENFDG